MAKGRDLEDAALDVDLLKETKSTLKQTLSSYGDRLEMIRERIEGAARLHHLLALDLKEKDVQLEMQRLAEKIGDAGLIERCRDASRKHGNEPITNSTPIKASATNTCACWREETRRQSNSSSSKTASTSGSSSSSASSSASSSGSSNSSAVVLRDRKRSGQIEKKSTATTTTMTMTMTMTTTAATMADNSQDDDEDHSKMADSGLGGCDRCEGNDKLVRTCSCQSFYEPASACNKRYNSYTHQ